MKGVGLLSIGKLMGHRSTTRMTERYAHISMENLREAAEKAWEGGAVARTENAEIEKNGGAEGI